MLRQGRGVCMHAKWRSKRPILFSLRFIQSKGKVLF